MLLFADRLRFSMFPPSPPALVGGAADRQSRCACAAAALSSGSPREVGQPGPLEQPSGSFLLAPKVLGQEHGVFQHAPFSGEVSSKF